MLGIYFVQLLLSLDNQKNMMLTHFKVALRLLKYITTLFKRFLREFYRPSFQIEQNLCRDYQSIENT